MTEKNSKDEIDILSLFSLIGKKSNSLLVLIINFIISFLNLSFSILFIIKKKYLILSISLIIGTLIGYVYEKNFYVPKYETTLTLSPNFGSTYHLYENIKFYQNLIEQKDFKKLSVYLNVDSTNAASLLSFSVKPYKNESLNLQVFKRLIDAADSTTRETLSYELFEDKIPFESYAFHVITLQTYKSEIPIQFEQSIIESLENNIYFKNKKETFIENLKIKKEYVLSSIQKLDTLLFAEKKNLNNENLGTTIVLDKNQNENIELQLFDRYTKLRNELVEINFQFKDKENVINTIDSFNELGVNVSDKNYILHGGLFLFLIMLLVLIFYHIYTLNPNFKFKKLSY